MSSQRPRIRLLAVGLVAAALAIPTAGTETVPARAADIAAAPAGAYTDADYLRFADRVQLRLDHLWDEESGLYRWVDATTNANLLLTHSVAALSGHRGPSRQDARARLLARRLTESTPFVDTPPPKIGDAQTHAPGWVASMSERASNQHLVIDAEVADGLRYAWLARSALGMSQETADLIADRLHRVARSRFWRWPTIRLNQINWYAQLYTADATVTGDPRLLRHDLRLQIERFAAGARGTASRAGNLGPGMHFHYLPDSPASHQMNVDSSEYANIVASFSRFYEQARRSGMAAPSPAARHLLQQWLLRVMSGYWTHGGYPNWDTGFGFRRWHQAKKFGLSQQALLGIATAPGLAAHRDMPAWAKWMLDRGFTFYARETDRLGDTPRLFFGVHADPQRAVDGYLGAARVMANAARAVHAGLGRARAMQPPPLYAYDPDNGRLAVTTPVYSTAIVAVTRGAFPYGGIEPARLFDGRHEIAAGIGGRPPASFGTLVRDVSGRRLLATQLPHTSRGNGTRYLRLTHAPRGVGASASARSVRAYAGPFRDLRATGTRRANGLAARSSHRFAAAFIESTWTLRRLAGQRRLTVDVLFPSTGREVARVTAFLRGGGSELVGARRLALRRVAYLHVESRYGGYVVVPRRVPAGATAHLLATRPQSSAPDPGPTLALQIARRERLSQTALGVRLAPARDAEHAAAVASRLAAR
jgi:hypothetical protein